MAQAYIEGAPMNTAKITAALAKLQANLPNVTLDGDNSHFKSKFMTLGNLSSVLLPKLSEQGLAYSVQSEVIERGVKVVSTLLHSSGEYLTAEFLITETQPQKVGSAVTYYRRYGLAMLTGVVADQDDDGNAVAQQAPAPLRRAQERKAVPAKAATARDKVRVEWIETGKVDKDDVNNLVSNIKSEKPDLKGDAIFEEVIARLSKGEV